MRPGDVVRLPEVSGAREQRGVVLGVEENGTVMVRIFESDRESDDVDGLVEVTSDQLVLVCGWED